MQEYIVRYKETLRTYIGRDILGDIGIYKNIKSRDI